MGLSISKKGIGGCGMKGKNREENKTRNYGFHHWPKEIWPKGTTGQREQKVIRIFSSVVHIPVGIFDCT